MASQVLDLLVSEFGAEGFSSEATLRDFRIIRDYEKLQTSFQDVMPVGQEW